MERRMLLRRRALYRGDASRALPSGGGGLGRASSGYRHFEPRTRKSAQGNLSVIEGIGAAQRFVAQFHAARNRRTGRRDESESRDPTDDRLPQIKSER